MKWREQGRGRVFGRLIREWVRNQVDCISNEMEASWPDSSKRNYQWLNNCQHIFRRISVQNQGYFIWRRESSEGTGSATIALHSISSLKFGLKALKTISCHFWISQFLWCYGVRNSRVISFSCIGWEGNTECGWELERTS